MELEPLAPAAPIFFFSGDQVQEKHPPNTWARVTGAIITGLVMWLVTRRQQSCYLVTMPDIDGKCFIIKKDFFVNVAPEVLFKSEHAPVIVAPSQPIHHDNDHAALTNVTPNIRVGDRLAKHIVELWEEGIDINYDNEPLN